MPRPRLALVATALLVALVSGVHGRDVNDASLQFQLGTLLFEETRYREALEAFRKAISADSKGISIQARMGRQIGAAARRVRRGPARGDLAEAAGSA